MNWQASLPGIAALFVSLTGLQTFDRDRPPQVTKSDKKAKLEFAVIACAAIGGDEYRYGAPGLDGVMRLTISGTRAFTLSVRCTGFSHKYTESAIYYLERIYTRLMLPTSGATLRALGVSWVDAGSLVNLSSAFTEDDRVFSVAQKDFMFTGVVNELADTDNAAPYIEHVEIASVYLYGVDGAQLTKQIGPVVVP